MMKINKAVLFLTLLPELANGRVPKFTFNECVKVTQGFYKDCKGRLQDWDESSLTYRVRLDACNGSNAIAQIEEFSLVRCEK